MLCETGESSGAGVAMIGVLGGTFDPVHYGHLRTALEVVEHFGLSTLRLIPGNVPPHRQQPVASPQQAADAVAAARKAGRDTVLMFVQRGNTPGRFVGVKIQ